MSESNRHTCIKAPPGWRKPGDCKACEEEKKLAFLFGSLKK